MEGEKASATVAFMPSGGPQVPNNAPPTPGGAVTGGPLTGNSGGRPRSADARRGRTTVPASDRSGAGTVQSASESDASGGCCSSGGLVSPSGAPACTRDKPPLLRRPLGTDDAACLGGLLPEMGHGDSQGSFRPCNRSVGESQDSEQVEACGKGVSCGPTGHAVTRNNSINNNINNNIFSTRKPLSSGLVQRAESASGARSDSSVPAQASKDLSSSEESSRASRGKEGELSVSPVSLAADADCVRQDSSAAAAVAKIPDPEGGTHRDQGHLASCSETPGTETTAVSALFEDRGPSWWPSLPFDTFADLIQKLDNQSQCKVRLVCKAWKQSFGESFSELRPKILATHCLAESFPNCRRLVLSGSLPYAAPESGSHQQKPQTELKPLNKMKQLQHLDLSTSPSLLFFGLGVKTRPQDVEALYLLPRLRSLNLAGQCYGVSWSLSVLSKLTNLTYLNVSGECALNGEDLSGVAHLTNLLELDLGERRFEADAELQQLSVVTALRTLQLRKCYFMDGGAQQVAGLSSLPRLSSLDMSYWCSVGDPVISIVSGLSSLTHLNISRTRVSDAGMSKLLRLPRLSILDASYCLDLRGHGLTRLENSTSLTMLNLSECKKLPDIRVRFSMRHSPQLQVMDVNSLRDEFMAKATSYGPTPGLTAVSLRGCHKVSRQTLQRLVEKPALSRLAVPVPYRLTGQKGLKFVSQLKNLEELHMDGSVEVAALDGELLGSLPKLRHLHLHQCLASGFCPPLRLLPNLTHLVIDQCSGFGSVTVDALVQCPSLTHLELNMQGDQWQYIDTSIITHLMPVFERLRVLKLGSCINLTDEAVLVISELCSNVTHLSLFGAVQLTDTGVGHLRTMPSLTNLDLSSCSAIGNESCTHLASLSSLSFVDLCCCVGIADDGLRALGSSATLRQVLVHGCTGLSSCGLKSLPRWICVSC